MAETQLDFTLNLVNLKNVVAAHIHCAVGLYTISVLDLNGINTRYGTRLNASGIFTPEAGVPKHCRLLLWYLRLRAYEIDQVDFGRKSFGNTYWHTGRKVEHPLYTTREIYLKALRLLNQSGYAKRVRNLAVSVYDLIPHHSEQLEMFSSRSHAVAEAMDRINDKYCEFVITPALMMGMDDTIIDRIAFGGVKELEELYQ